MSWLLSIGGRKIRESVIFIIFDGVTPVPESHARATARIAGVSRLAVFCAMDVQAKRASDGRGHDGVAMVQTRATSGA